MAYRVMAYRVMAYRVMAYRVMAYRVMAYRVMAYRVMAYRVMAYRVMAYTVVAYIVMAQRDGADARRAADKSKCWPCRWTRRHRRPVHCPPSAPSHEQPAANGPLPLTRRHCARPLPALWRVAPTVARLFGARELPAAK